MTKAFRIAVAAVTMALFAASTAVVAQTTTPDAKPPVKKTMKHHARKAATPARDMYLRAAGSEPAPKAAK